MLLISQSHYQQRALMCIAQDYALRQAQLITWGVQHRFATSDDQVKEGAHGAFTPDIARNDEASLSDMDRNVS